MKRNQKQTNKTKKKKNSERDADNATGVFGVRFFFRFFFVCLKKKRNNWGLYCWPVFSLSTFIIFLLVIPFASFRCYGKKKKRIKTKKKLETKKKERKKNKPVFFFLNFIFGLLYACSYLFRDF